MYRVIQKNLIHNKICLIYLGNAFSDSLQIFQEAVIYNSVYYGTHVWFIDKIQVYAIQFECISYRK